MFDFVQAMTEHYARHDAVQHQGLNKSPWKDKYFRRTLDFCGLYDYRVNDHG